MNEVEHLQECVDQARSILSWLIATLEHTPHDYRHVVVLQNMRYMMKDNIADLERLLPRKEEQE